MASSVALFPTRWITVAVSSGHRRACNALVCAFNGGVRTVSTLAAQKIWPRGNRAGTGMGNALTLRGLSGEWCIH